MDLIAIKVTAAGLAMVLAILQALIILQLYGKRQLFPLSAATLATWHRRQGDLILALFLFVAYQCLTKAMVDWGDWRLATHAVLAALAVLTVLAKFCMVQLFPRSMRFVTAVGLTLFVSAMGATGTTVLWYLYMWLGRGVRPAY